jgi:predicted metal-dependent peptidase
MTAEQMIQKAKLQLVMQRSTTFFSSLLASLKLELTPAIPTAATDGLRLLINPEYVADLTPRQLLGLLVHEVMHVALDHMNRASWLNLNPDKWNMAGDYYINLYLTDRSFEIPPGGLLDYAYQGMSTKAIYDQLPDPPEGFDRDLLLDPDKSPSQQAEEREQIITAVMRAVTQAHMAKDPGSIPGEVSRSLEEIIRPRLPWQVILLNHLSSKNRDSFDWTRPNRRYSDLYLPSIKRTTPDQILCAIDVSGSISQKDLDAFLAEIQYLLEVIQPNSLRLISFDTQVHQDLTYTKGDLLSSPALTGGGGTNCSPIIELIRKEQPEISIIFTDGEFRMPNLSQLSTDLFWIVFDNQHFNPNHGTVILYA